MTETSSKGNDPVKWTKLLDELDDKLQFGLLEKLRRATSYHFEGDTLFLVPFSDQDLQYLSKNAVFQQLQIFVQGAIGIEKVKINKE